MRDLAKRNLTCPCGTYVRGEDEDDLVEKAMQHLREDHPELAEQYGREEILFIAY